MLESVSHQVKVCHFGFPHSQVLSIHPSVYMVSERECVDDDIYCSKYKKKQ